jgi:hypothetical protein
MWHGRSDFVSARAILRSPIALATLLFIGLHVFTVAGLIAGAGRTAVISSAALALMCAAAAVRQFRHRPVPVILENTVVYYLYFVGRSLAFFQARSARGSFVHRERR